MTLILTRTVKPGEVIKKEFWVEDRYCRQDVMVNTTTSGADKMEVGAVLYQDGKTGNYLELVDAFDETTDNIAILIDETVQDEIDGAVAELAVIFRGPAVVVGLNYGAATDSGAEANTALASVGISVQTQV